MTRSANDSEAAIPATFRRFVVLTNAAELGGYTFVEIRADAVARYLAGDFLIQEDAGEDVMVPTWRLAEFSIPKATLSAFIALIESSGFRDLETRYVDNAAHDGFVQDFLFEEASGTKQVHCDNRAPQAVQTLQEFIRREILPAANGPLAAAPSLTHDQARRYWESVAPELADGGR